MKYAIPVLMFAAVMSVSAQEKKVPKDSLRVSIPGVRKAARLSSPRVQSPIARAMKSPSAAASV
jgi:hypothetical protein